MKVLHWYSLVWISLGVLSISIDLLSGKSGDVAADLWAVALTIPVLVFLGRLFKKK